MSNYDVYKHFGRVIGEKESKVKLALVFANWYERPYLKFIIWIERVKRYVKADVRLQSDNPFGCLFYLCIIIVIFLIMILGKILL